MRKKIKRKSKAYSEEEFLDHFRALPIVRKYQHISRSFDGTPEQVEVGDDPSFEIHALRVMDYFSQIYSDKEEAREKGVLFLVMLTHLAKHRAAYDSERFAVFTDSEEPSMISVPLLRAIHHHYTQCPLRELPREEQLVESIKKMARDLFENEKV